MPGSSIVEARAYEGRTPGTAALQAPRRARRRRLQPAGRVRDEGVRSTRPGQGMVRGGSPGASVRCRLDGPRPARCEAQANRALTTSGGHRSSQPCARLRNCGERDDAPPVARGVTEAPSGCVEGHAVAALDAARLRSTASREGCPLLGNHPRKRLAIGDREQVVHTHDRSLSRQRSRLPRAGA